MKKKPDPTLSAALGPGQAVSLRMRAETAQRQRRGTGGLPQTEADLQRLVHELQVHQIELEMQNEELRQARVEIEAGLARYTELYDFAPVGFFTLSRDGRICQINLYGANLLGVERYNLLGNRFRAFIVDRDWLIFSDFLDQVFAQDSAPTPTPKTCEVTLNIPLADLRLFSANLSQRQYFSETNQRVLHIEAAASADRQTCRAVAMDVTCRKAAENQVQREAEVLDAVLKSLQETVALLDTQGNILNINPNGAKRLGATPAQLIGKNAYALLPEPIASERKKIITQVMQTEQPAFFEDRRQNCTFLNRVYPIRDPQLGGLLGAVILAEDITERKKIEQQLARNAEELEKRIAERTRELQEAQEKLVRQEKLALLGQLAGGVGHELRNPLTVIRNATYFLKMTQPDAGEKVREYLQMIEVETHTAEKIISDLLDFSRVRPGDPEPLDVSALLQQTLKRQPAPASVQVSFDLPSDLPQVYADQSQMIQVLGNLIVNAYEAMPAGGALSLSARCQPAGVAIAVTDSGAGILPENMAKLFEPLFTTKTRGIGLGLLISRKLAESNHGRIEVHSQPGNGATFTLFLPVKP